MIVAIIPARGGSKRIPGKNVKMFAGKPIIYYSIEAARKAKCFDKIIVTTDSEDIARIAVEAGAEVPFLRPKELAGDFVSNVLVLEHAVNWFGERGTEVEYFCCIQATAPFVCAGDIIEGFKLLVENKVSSAFSVTTFSFPIFRALRLKEDGHLEMFWPENENVRSNDLPEAYHDAGQFYWLETKGFLNNRQIYSPDAMPVILPRYLVQDIDTPEDWETAERMFKSLQ